jgi:hypothetical protein
MRSRPTLFQDLLCMFHDRYHPRSCLYLLKPINFEKVDWLKNRTLWGHGWLEGVVIRRTLRNVKREFCWVTTEFVFRTCTSAARTPRVLSSFVNLNITDPRVDPLPTVRSNLRSFRFALFEPPYCRTCCAYSMTRYCPRPRAAVLKLVGFEKVGWLELQGLKKCFAVGREIGGSFFCWRRANFLDASRRYQSILLYTSGPVDLKVRVK